MAPEPSFVYIEDEPFSQEIMELLMVRQLGYSNFIIFSDSARLIEKLEGLPTIPTVIFVDIHVQPHNGFEMLQQLRAHPAYHNVMIVALTASVMNEEITLLKDAGFDGGIAKPLDQLAFPEIIQRILQREEVWHIM